VKALIRVAPKHVSVAVSDFDRQRDISKLHSTKHDNPYLANRILAALSKFFNWCEAEGARPVGSNPSETITPFKEEAREPLRVRGLKAPVIDGYAS
jgi:hypothetical protein